MSLDKKGTSLWKAVLFEARIPWRYKEMLPAGFRKIINKHVFYRFSRNINDRGYWDKKLGKFGGGKWRDHSYAPLLEILPKNKKFSLLDIGCALGDGCILIKKRFPNADISGCDISSVGVKKAGKKTDKIDFFVLDLLKEEIPGKYDYITMMSVLEHFDNPIPLIDKCLEKARKCLIIDCPYARDISYKPDDEHRSAFNEKSLIGYDHDYERHGSRITFRVFGKKEKILFVIDRLGEGAGRVVYDLVNNLDNDKFESIVAPLYPEGNMAGMFKRLKTKIVCLNKKPGKDLGLILRIKRIIKDERISIVHTHNVDAYEYGVLAAWLAGAEKIVHTAHGKSVKRGRLRKLRENMFHRLVSMFLDDYIAVSNDLGKYAARNWCLSKGRIKTIYNGIDTKKYRKIKTDKGFLYKMGVGRKDLLVGIVAGLRPVKNHADLIRAMKIVKNDVHFSKLLIIGDGPERKKLEELAREMGLEKEILFLGNRDDIVRLMNCLDVHALCSFSECLSMTLLESMACEVPSVATDVGGNRELIGRGTGFLVPAGDSVLLAGKIISLLKDDRLRIGMGKKARERVVRHFGIRKMIEGYEKIYSE